MVKYHHQTYGKTDDPEFNDDDALFGLGPKKTTKFLVSQTSAKTQWWRSQLMNRETVLTRSPLRTPLVSQALLKILFTTKFHSQVDLTKVHALAYTMN